MTPGNRTIWLLSGGLVFTITLMALMQIGAVRVTDTLAELTTKMHRHPFAVSNAVLQANANIIAMHRHMKDVVLARNSADLELAVSHLNINENEIYGHFDIITERFLGDMSEIETARQAFADWKIIRSEVINLSKAGKYYEATLITKGKGAVNAALLTARMDSLIQFASNKADEFLTNSQAKYKESRTDLYVLMTLVIVISGAVGILIIVNVRAGEKRVQESEAKYREIIEETDDLITTVDREGRFVFVNSKSKKIFGLPPEECIGRLAFDFIHPDDQRTTIEAFEGWLRDKPTIITIENRQVSVTGVIHTMLWAINFHYDDVGNIETISNIARDITTQKEQERELVHEKKLLEDVGRISKTGGWEIDVATMQLKWSTETYRIHEVSDDYEPNVEEAVNFYARESQPIITAAVKAAFKDGTPWDMELSLITAKGRSIWVRILGEAVYENGKIITVMGTFQNITERKRIETALMKSEENLRTTLNSIGDAVISVDTSGNVIRINPVAETLSGWKAKDAVGQNLNDVFQIINARTREPAFNPVNKVLAEGKIVGLANHTILLSRDGSEYQIADSAAPVRNDANQITGVVLVFRDVTEEYAIQEDLNNALVDAERANQAKSEFLASMSHELRTPLNAVLGFAQMMQFDPKNPLTPEQNKHADSILEGGNHLLKLVNEILDLARIESDQVDLSLIDVVANEVTANCVSLISPLAKQKNLKIIDQFSSGPTELLFTDQMRLKQALINLLSNTVKFNRDGGTVTLEGQQTEYGYLRISVTDTGVGIAKEDHASVFNIFHRINADPMVTREGTGIGLTVTKQLIVRMAGRVGFESEVGVGSTFWIELPLASNDDVLIWTDAVTVGFDALDKDHQAIVSLLNHIMRCSVDEAGVDGIIEELIDYIHYHFRREEAIMETCDYPALENHRKFHQEFIAQVSEKAETCRNERSQKSLNQFRKFSKDWLFDHILKEDSKITSYTKGKGRAISQALALLEEEF